MNFIIAMFPALSNYGTETKLTITALIGLAAAVTDAQTDAKGWEDVTLKGLCIIAVVFLGKLFLDAQKKATEAQEKHKEEIKDTWDAHKKDAEDREAKLLAAVAENTKSLTELNSLTKEQNEFHRAFTRRLLEASVTKPTLP